MCLLNTAHILESNLFDALKYGLSFVIPLDAFQVFNETVLDLLEDSLLSIFMNWSLTPKMTVDPP